MNGISPPQFTGLDVAEHSPPRLVSPGGSSARADLIDWISDHEEQIDEALVEHGALLFRDFDVPDALAFEELALSLEPGLQNQYLGTSPRNAVTRYVFSASEIPNFFPIPQHCEMTFLKNAPDRVFFYCDIEPTSIGGETPLTDMKRVADELDPSVRSRFEQRQLKIIRNYTGPNTRSFDPWQLKPWHEMFLTEDRESIEEQCEREGIECIWRDGDRLRLISYQPAFQEHPVTGDVVWFNHTQVFHKNTAEAELRRIARVQDDLRSSILALFSELVSGIRGKLVPSDRMPMHVTWADGEEIDRDDLEHVRDVIWRNTVRVRWREGDVVMIDNNRVAHGRMPFRGPRRILVAWA